MKTNLLRKAKWYIGGFILVAIMLSLSLSFCTWDTLSVKAKLENSNSGNFYKMYKVVDDVDGNKIADVGDVVTFGNYYQSLTGDGNVAEKTAIRWIVVHKENNELTLLAEKVMAFGSFWGTHYYNSAGVPIWPTTSMGSYYQNYSQSTVRAWLNSSTRTDDGTAIDKNSKDGVAFKGFLSEAFTADEQAYIVSKQISGIKGYGKDNSPSTPTEAYATVSDKIWIPSWSEVYGTTTIGTNPESSFSGVTIDGSPNTRFSYFKDTTYNDGKPTLNGCTTAFASSQYSNYTFSEATHIYNAQDSAPGGSVWWWLRSPQPSDHTLELVVINKGYSTGAYLSHSKGGVRPAVCVQL